MKEQPWFGGNVRPHNTLFDKIFVIRAADWNLAEPSWTGRMRLISKGDECFIKLEDKNSGELFAKCPIETYPGIAIESVTDSSRYFVLRIQDDNGITYQQFLKIPSHCNIIVF